MGRRISWIHALPTGDAVVTIIPNRLACPLSTDERLAEHYIDNPRRLVELARETGNRALYQLAIEFQAQKKRKKRTRV